MKRIRVSRSSRGEEKENKKEEKLKAVLEAAQLTDGDSSSMGRSEA